MLATLTLETGMNGASVEITEIMKDKNKVEYEASRTERIEPNNVKVIMSNNALSIMIVQDSDPVE